MTDVTGLSVGTDPNLAHVVSSPCPHPWGSTTESVQAIESLVDSTTSTQLWPHVAVEFVASLPWSQLTRIRPWAGLHRPDLLPAIDRALSHLGKFAAIAESWNSSPHALGQAARCLDVSVRLRVAGNPRTSPETLRRLSTDAHSSVVVEVASNPRCPPSVLKALCDHPEARLRAVANANLPVLMKRSLAFTAEGAVSVALAGNPALPWGAISTLLDRDDPDTIHVLMKCHLDRIMDKGSLEQRMLVCVLVTCEVWGGRGVPSESELRRALLANPCSPHPLTWASGVVDMLSDPDPHVRAGAVPFCPWGACVELVHDPEWFVRAALLRHRDVDAATVSVLAADSHGTVQRIAGQVVMRGLLV